MSRRAASSAASLTRLARSAPANPAVRAKLYAQVQALAANDAFLGFLYYSPFRYATSSKVHGFFVEPLGNYHMENVWLG